MPGLTLQQNGGAGTVTSLFSRGGESDYTLVLVDGIRQNSFGGGLDISQVPLQDVERIEVLRGSQSALYGSDAIGGVIQIITRSGGKPSAQAQVETGSRDMRRAAGCDDRRDQGRCVGRPARTTSRMRASPASRERRDGQQRRCSGDAGLGFDRISACIQRRRPQGNLQYVDSERGSPGAYRIGSGESLLRR